MKKKLIGWILKAPWILTLVASFIASIYIVTNKDLQAQYGIQVGTSIILGVILVLYIIGEYLQLSKPNSNTKTKTNELTSQEKEETKSNILKIPIKKNSKK